MALSVVQARKLIAKSVKGGANDQDLKNDAMEALILALSELNTDHCYEFLATAVTLTSTAGTADYTVPSNLLKVYSVLWGADYELAYRSQRVDDRFRPDKTSNSPLGYNLYPLGALTKMRLMPKPGTDNVLIKVKYYRRISIPAAASATAGDIDLPTDFQYWPVFQGKAHFLGDRNAPPMRIQYWQQKADKTLARMKWMDQQHPGETVSLEGRPVGTGLPPEHTWNAVIDAYGF